MRVAILPSGALFAGPALDGDEAPDGLSDVARGRLALAFARGSGNALLHLGTAEVDAPLAPPLAYLREIGRLFVTRLCGLPDLEARRERAIVDCPPEERVRLAGAVPPMEGGEYVDPDWIAARWTDLHRAFADEIREHGGTVEGWLTARHASWHVVGKVCLHLAENAGDEAHPFAFLATYAARAAGRRVQHRPLARAMEESSARGDRQALLHLLIPLQHAAEQIPWLGELVDSGAIYQAMAWTPADAYRFLRAIPTFEAAGLVVRVPDWWRPRRPPRPVVTVRVGEKKPSALGMDALLDFSVGLALGGEKLTAPRMRQAPGVRRVALVRLRGQWVELDRGAAARGARPLGAGPCSGPRRDGLSFLDGMRLLAGAGRSADEADDARRGRGLVTRRGRRLARAHARGTARSGRAGGGRPRAPICAARCGPIRRSAWRGWPSASSLRLGVCLADDMGLGKTIQVLGLSCSCTGARARRGGPPHLLMCRRPSWPTGRRRSSASRRRW